MEHLFPQSSSLFTAFSQEKLAFIRFLTLTLHYLKLIITGKIISHENFIDLFSFNIRHTVKFIKVTRRKNTAINSDKLGTATWLNGTNIL